MNVLGINSNDNQGIRMSKSIVSIIKFLKNKFLSDEQSKLMHGPFNDTDTKVLLLIAVFSVSISLFLILKIVSITSSVIYLENKLRETQVIITELKKRECN